MDNVANLTVGVKTNLLLPTPHACKRPATIGESEVHPVRISSGVSVGALHELDVGMLSPVSNCVMDHVLWKARIDRIGYQRIRPAKLPSRNAHAKDDRAT